MPAELMITLMALISLSLICLTLCHCFLDSSALLPHASAVSILTIEKKSKQHGRGRPAEQRLTDHRLLYCFYCVNSTTRESENINNEADQVTMLQDEVTSRRHTVGSMPGTPNTASSLPSVDLWSNQSSGSRFVAPRCSSGSLPLCTSLSMCVSNTLSV